MAMLTVTMTYAAPSEAMAKTFTLNLKATRVTLLAMHPHIKPPTWRSSRALPAPEP